MRSPPTDRSAEVSLPAARTRFRSPGPSGSRRTTRRWISTDSGTRVTALRHRPDAWIGWRFLYAPGAGSNLDDPLGHHLAQALPARGIEVIRFQFPYMEAGRKMPDRAPVLEQTWRAVIEAFRGGAARLAVGGRSMGGRMASHVVSQGAPVEALILLAYPLHPPGRPEKRRDRHLPGISAPTLFCSGTRDAFATPSEIRTAASLLPDSRVHLLEGADHGFNVLKSSGRTREEVWSEAVSAIQAWLPG